MIDEVIKIAIEAGDRILEWYGKDVIPTKRKDDDSPLTLADEDANTIIVESLTSMFDFPILTEESLVDYAVRKNWLSYWLVDPLDGTRNFLSKDGQFTVNIALIENQKPILGVVFAPALELCYSAERGKGAFLNGKRIFNDSKRTELIAATSSKHGNSETEEFLKRAKIADARPYGSSLKLCKLAEGEIDIYPRLGTTCEWDIAAGDIIATEGGAKLIDVTTRHPLVYNKENLENNHFIAYRKDLDINKFL